MPAEGTSTARLLRKANRPDALSVQADELVMLLPLGCCPPPLVLPETRRSTPSLCSMRSRFPPQESRLWPVHARTVSVHRLAVHFKLIWSRRGLRRNTPEHLPSAYRALAAVAAVTGTAECLPRSRHTFPPSSKERFTTMMRLPSGSVTAHG